VNAGRLEDHVAIVTGGARGLGRAMALGLAGAGARVIATASRERAEVERVAAERGDGRIIPMIADVTREDDCARVVAAAHRQFGRLDMLVNNAGRGMKYVSKDFLTEPTRIWETDPDVWRMVIDTNVIVAAIPAFGAGRAFHDNELFILVWAENLIHSIKFVHGEWGSAIIAVIKDCPQSLPVICYKDYICLEIAADFRHRIFLHSYL
jgi:NAD(P)-dependent dehydrogenase (short-subunit alcohol dehydrogenase family)